MAPVMWQVRTAEQLSDQFYCFLILATLLQQIHSLTETTGENSEAREPAEEAGEAYHMAKGRLQKKKRDYVGKIPKLGGGGSDPNPLVDVYLPSYFWHAKMILRC